MNYPVYYNEIDRFNIAWLEELIRRKQLPYGHVDERSIEDVEAKDLKPYRQCHFFAGIGGWALAARIAGLPPDANIWTGSCPCQPFSVSGRKRGFSDSRHLFPAWNALIRQRRPVCILGEQVADLAWIDHVSDALEDRRYAVGAVCAPACLFGAPHQRQRLYWMAAAQINGHKIRVQAQRVAESAGQVPTQRRTNRGATEGHSTIGARALGNAHNAGQQGRRLPRTGALGQNNGERAVGATGVVDMRALGNAQRRKSEQSTRQWSASVEAQSRKSYGESTGSGAVGGFWQDAAWCECEDNVSRPFEPGAFPLADGVPARVGRLRGYGNAIVIPQAVSFVRSYMELAL